jgi:hypothetical protein
MNTPCFGRKKRQDSMFGKTELGLRATLCYGVESTRLYRRFCHSCSCYRLRRSLIEGACNGAQPVLSEANRQWSKAIAK